MPDYERRVLPAGELRVTQDDNRPPVIEGYSSVFNQYSEDLGGWIEIIEPGFFDDVMEGDTRALWNHDPNYVLGRTISDTLELEQDGNGLHSRVIPPDTTWARDLLVSIRRGDINQQSFGFRVKSLAAGDPEDGDEWYVMGDKVVRRLKKKGCKELYDISPVTFPAYPQTDVSATRSRFEEFRKTIPAPQPETPGGASDPGTQAEAPGPQVRHGLRRKRMELAEIMNR